MKRNKKIFIVSALLLICLCTMVAVNRAYDGKTAIIYKDGEVFCTVSLSTDEAYEIAIGDGNTALVENGRISMIRADCPDKLCVNQGAVDNGMFPIVCMPNRVVIEVSSNDVNNIGAMTGR